MKDSKSVTGILHSAYDSFFDAEKKIADYILLNKNEVVEMTVAELARSSKTSDATVSRFCRRCGFKGFHHLKISLAKEAAQDKKSANRISNEISREDIAQSLENILANKMDELAQTVSMIDCGQMKEILNAVEHAGTVLLAAAGNMQPVCLDGAYKLNQLGIPAVTSTMWETQMAYACNLKKGDAVIIISGSGSSLRLLKLLDRVKEKGCSVIALTNNPHSPLARACDYHVTVATRERFLLGEFCFSRASAMMVMEMICLFLAEERRDTYEKIRRHE